MQVNVKQEEEDDDESNSDPTGRLGLKRRRLVYFQIPFIIFASVEMKDFWL